MGIISAADLQTPRSAHAIGAIRLIKLALNATLPRVHCLNGRDPQENYDALTGLANRILFESRLDIARARLKHHGRVLAVLVLDIDGFASVNAALGDAAGDDLLRQFAQRLKSAFRHSDTIACFGGDDFAILVEDLAAPEDAEITARKVINLLASPFLCGGGAIEVAISIGIACAIPGQDIARETLLRQADAAMHDSKLQPGSFYRSFPGLLTHLASASADDENLPRHTPNHADAGRHDDVRVTYAGSTL